MNELFLIRHGEVIEAYKGVFAGRTDIELSENGKKQAIATAKYLMSHSVSSVYASPMKRVRQTLQPFVELSGIKPIFLGELVEIDFGEWTGLNFEEVANRFGVNAYSWLEQIEAGRIDGAETTEVLRRRVEPVLSRILIENTQGNVAIFSHGGIIRVILSVLLDIPLVKLGKIGIDYCSVSKICVNGLSVSLRLLNYLPWKNNLLPYD
ncbi:MAG: histidine phosphatase family protein [Verrucomicrobiia bacterium]|jgi:broad specificity phosphatase PhoE